MTPRDPSPINMMVQEGSYTLGSLPFSFYDSECTSNVSLALKEEYAGIKPEYPGKTNLAPPDQTEILDAIQLRESARSVLFCRKGALQLTSFVRSCTSLHEMSCDPQL